MKTSCLVINTSDFHLEHSAKVVFDYVMAEFPHVNEFALIGDRSIDPDFSETSGKNLLRDAKIEAKKQGENHIEAENEVWVGEYQSVLVRQWLGTLKPTQRMHEVVEGYVRSAKIAQILDLGGNDWDKQKRVLKAYEFSKTEGKTLFDILDTSFAFRKLQGIEFKVIGKTLEINIPYIEEKRNEWYKPVFDNARKVNPDSRVLHIFGHCHKIPQPYEFNGILLVPVGYGKKESLQRVFVQDYLNPGNDTIQDLKLN